MITVILHKYYLIINRVTFFSFSKQTDAKKNSVHFSFDFTPHTLRLILFFTLCNMY